MATAAEPVLQLRDIHIPPAPPWWPPAPGWWLLAALALVLLLLGGWWLVRALRRRRRQRVVTVLLDGLEAALREEPAPQRLAELSALLKRIALQRHARRDVAALCGEPWLNFLDRTGGDGFFANGPGRVLADGVYRPVLVEALDVDGLMNAARQWVRCNTAGRP